MPQSTWFNVNQRLLDQYIQKWRRDVETSDKCYNYKLFKTALKLKREIFAWCTTLFKFGTVNQLLIETGRYTRIPTNQRLDKICNSGQLGDGYHFGMECPVLQELKNSFYPQIYVDDQIFSALDTSHNKRLLYFIVILSYIIYLDWSNMNWYIWRLDINIVCTHYLIFCQHFAL